jgi:hypothetical protein
MKPCCARHARNFGDIFHLYPQGISVKKFGNCLQLHGVISQMSGSEKPPLHFRHIFFFYYVSPVTYGKTRSRASIPGIHSLCRFESASELYRSSDRRRSAKLVPTLADRGCHVVSATRPSDRNSDFLDLGFPALARLFFCFV